MSELSREQHPTVPCAEQIIAALRQRCEAAEREIERIVTTPLATQLLNANHRLEEQIADLTAQLAAYQSREELHGKLSERVRLQERIDELEKSPLAMVEGFREVWRKEKEQLERQKAHALGSWSIANDVAFQRLQMIDKLKARLATMTQERDALRVNASNDYSQIQEQGKTIASLQRQLAAAQDEARRLREAGSEINRLDRCLMNSETVIEMAMDWCEQRATDLES